MSSSPQISSQDGNSNSLSSFSKVHSNGGSASASASVSASASASASTSANSVYKLSAQEETVLQKEIVRISPPLHQKEIPVSTYYTNGHLKNPRTESHAHNLRIRKFPPFEENKLIISDWTYRKFYRVDRECQTDRSCEFHSENMANDCEMEPISFNLYPEIHNQNSQHMEDQHSSKSENDFPSQPDTDSKDRDQEDIEVSVPLNTKLCEADDIDCISEQPRLNGSAISNDNKIYENKDNLKKPRDDWSNKNEEEEKDSCCTSCLLITLNVCDCVIL